jgi:hypothetical protein
MCQCVIYNDKKYCTQGELLTICPAGLVVLGNFERDVCLCSVDLPLTASANGYLIDSTSDPFDVIFSREAIIHG